MTQPISPALQMKPPSHVKTLRGGLGKSWSPELTVPQQTHWPFTQTLPCATSQTGPVPQWQVLVGPSVRSAPQPQSRHTPLSQ